MPSAGPKMMPETVTVAMEGKKKKVLQESGTMPETIDQWEPGNEKTQETLQTSVETVENHWKCQRRLKPKRA